MLKRILMTRKQMQDLDGVIEALKSGVDAPMTTPAIAVIAATAAAVGAGGMTVMAATAVVDVVKGSHKIDDVGPLMRALNKLQVGDHSVQDLIEIRKAAIASDE